MPSHIDVQTLYRPVGLFELVLVARAGYRAYPPRLPEQPIFYPVLNAGYAREIATRWNLDDPNSGFSGFVTQFDVPVTALAGYERRVVGAERHEELWVPAAEQAALESRFVGPITVSGGWLGTRFRETMPSWSGPLGVVSPEGLDDLLSMLESAHVHGGPLTEGAPNR